MADDSHHIQEEFKFHPCDTPRGMTYYKLTELTEEQQIKLNGHKINIIRQNQIYLNEHPEVKAIISTILKAILRVRPKVTLQEFLSRYFTTAWPEIKREIDKAIAEKTTKAPMEKPVSDSTILRALEGIEIVEEVAEATSATRDEDSLMQTQSTICRSILHGIITDMKSDDLTYGDFWDTVDDAKATPYPSEITLYAQSTKIDTDDLQD